MPGNYGGETAGISLKEQKKHLGKARLASVATVVQAVFAAIATLIGLAVLPEAIVGKVIVFAIAVIPIILALRSRSRATAARENAKQAGDRAWQAAAEDVAARAKDGITAGALAKTLGIETAHADKLLTELAVHDRTRVDVGDDAEVRYSVAPDVLAAQQAQQVRVAEPAPNADTQAMVEAEAEAEAEIEAAGAQLTAETKKERGA